ncbi:hypothetical protein [Microbacterium sp. NPDC076911]|uniref:hypothetical protein n=1 Tax=Microbacterium sp. NPDC076911 TaxID=3154958 RepID=UPI00343A4756
MRPADIADHLDTILSMNDPAARNIEITRCYCAISDSLAEVLGSHDLNWFSFGAWASATAGRAIRGESLPVDWGTSVSVAAGNLAIIADVAPPFIRWLEEIHRHGGANQAALGATLEHPSLMSAPQLKAALVAYQLAIDLRAVDEGNLDVESDRAAAQLVLLGNVLIGAHEQALVDEFIDVAMPLGGIFGLVTTRFVSIETPDGSIDVCRDVPPPRYLAGARFPLVLDSLANPDLVALALRFGQSPTNDVSASNALSWESYDERMGFILTFFRAYQRDARFFVVPAEVIGA